MASHRKQEARENCRLHRPTDQGAALSTNLLPSESENRSREISVESQGSARVMEASTPICCRFLTDTRLLQSTYPSATSRT